MKSLFTILSVFLLSVSAHAYSWYYNENGGLGIAEPDGWSIHENGRSASLVGPSQDFAQSKIFFGSDWQSGIKTDADLKASLQKQYPHAQWTPITLSERSGYQMSNGLKGQVAILRLPENVIVLQYDLRGSPDQIEQGKAALSSFDIRTQEYQP